MNVSDQMLIERVIKRGDKQAYSHLVRRYQSDLRLSLRQLCRGDTALADDMAQEAFIKAYRAIASFRADAKFSTWLYRIAFNVTVSHFRKKQAVIDQEIAAIVDQESSSFSKAEIAIDVEKAMNQLSDNQRAAVHLCLDRGFSHSEAADIMDIPLGTVKTHLLRGREKLKSHLADWYLNGMCKEVS